MRWLFGFWGSELLAPNSKFPGQLRWGGNSRIIAAFIQLLPHHLVGARYSPVGGRSTLHSRSCTGPHWTTLDHTGPYWTTLGGVSSSGANGWCFLAEEYLCSGHAFLPNPSCSYPTLGRINYHSDANTRRTGQMRERFVWIFPSLHLWLPRLSRLYLGTSVHYLPPSVHPNITLQRTAEVDLSVSTSLFFPMSSQTLNLLMKKARRPDHLQQEKNNPERAVIAKSPLK